MNGTEETFAASPFTFTQDLASGDQYAVLFVSTPANQQCTISNGVGTAIANVTNVSLTCTDPITLLQYQDAEVAGIMTSSDFDGDGFTDLVFTIRTLAGHPTGSNNDMFRVTYGNGTGVISLGNGDGTFADNNGSDTRSISILLDPDVDLFDMDVTDIDSDSY